MVVVEEEEGDSGEEGGEGEEEEEDGIKVVAEEVGTTSTRGEATSMETERGGGEYGRRSRARAWQ